MQLGLFDSVVEGVNSLIDALNCGSKLKDLYYGSEIMKVSETRFVALALNRDNKPVFNVVDQNGKVPAECSSCWRIWPHIERELNITVSDLDKFETYSLGAITQKSLSYGFDEGYDEEPNGCIIPLCVMLAILVAMVLESFMI